MIGATLTLPGIAGIVLTIGMAVDANVLIFSRIREELRDRAPQAAIQAGFDRAFVTILDANITTFFVAIILLSIGSGPVKGFAITLAIGIATSMFTAILGTRALVNLMFGGRKLTQLTI
jgi:preprotein translocase subunit SecD